MLWPEMRDLAQRFDKGELEGSPEGTEERKLSPSPRSTATASSAGARWT